MTRDVGVFRGCLGMYLGQLMPGLQNGRAWSFSNARLSDRARTQCSSVPRASTFRHTASPGARRACPENVVSIFLRTRYLITHFRTPLLLRKTLPFSSNRAVPLKLSHELRKKFREAPQTLAFALYIVERRHSQRPLVYNNKTHTRV